MNAITLAHRIANHRVWRGATLLVRIDIACELALLAALLLWVNR
jgi:hypothetical protein